MNRRILIQVTAPAILIGLLLFGTCLASVWSINRLQRNLASILAENVVSLEAAQELEIKLRQLRFHSFLNVLDPSPARLALVEQDHHGFEAALEQAHLSANLAEEQKIVAAIQVGYLRYRSELAQALPAGTVNRSDLIHWADAHPVHHLLDPCQELLRVNKEAMEQTARESESVSQQARTAMVLLGLLGPASGLVGGFGIARGLSRSIARLSVRVQDVHAQLDQEVASVRLAAEGGLQDLDQQLERVVGRVQEVVERLQWQQQEMLRAEQLAALGQLAASVAHEVRNPLTAIKLLIGAALRSRSGQTLTLEDLQVIYREIGRLEQTAQNLLDIARPSPAHRETGDVREVLSQALDLVRARANQQRVVLDVRQPGQPVRASVDRGQFCTVFVNLFLNALDAMPQGGRIEVDLEAPTSGEIRITVLDTGPGLAAAVAGRLFTPFTSTKPTGTGLGLSICRRILQEHGGSITAQNRPEGGASFALVLPCHSCYHGKEDGHT